MIIAFKRVMKVILAVIIAFSSITTLLADDIDETYMDESTTDMTVATPPLTKAEKSKIFVMFPFAEKNRQINSYFGYRIIFGREEFHNGIDIDADVGTPVLAAHSGFVVLVGENSISGQHIAIESMDGSYRTHYGHLKSIPEDDICVAVFVLEGDLLGLVGETCKSCTGPHLHFVLKYKRKGEKSYKSINPLHLFYDRPPKKTGF